MPRYSQYSNLADVSVAPVTFTPAVFKPTEFRVEEPNWNLAQQAIHEHNRIVETVASNEDAIQSTINQLDINDVDREYLNQYAQNVRDRINDKLEAGDYRGAMRESIASARTAATDRSLLTRVKRNQDQKKEQDDILKSKEYSDLTKRRWVKENGYGSGLVVNDDNTVNSWNANWKPVADVGIESLASYAAKFVAEKSTSTASSQSGPTAKSISGVDLTDPNAIVGTGGHSHFTRKYKTKEDIKSVLDEFSITNPDQWRALQQQYDNYKFIIDEYEKAKLSGQPMDQMMELEYDTAKKYMSKVAGVTDVYEFIWKLIGGTVERMAYDNTSSDVGSSTSFVGGGSKQGSDGGNGEETPPPLLTGQGSTPGGKIRGNTIIESSIKGTYWGGRSNTDKSSLDEYYN